MLLKYLSTALNPLKNGSSFVPQGSQRKTQNPLLQRVFLCEIFFGVAFGVGLVYLQIFGNLLLHFLEKRLICIFYFA